MSRGPTIVRFIWRRGIPFTLLSRAVFDYCVKAGHPFQRLSVWGDGRTGIFKVMRYECEPPFDLPHGPWEHVAHPNKVIRLWEFTDAPWEDDPWGKPGIGDISWVALESARLNSVWGEFHVRIEESLRYCGSRMPAKVHYMDMGFYGDLARAYERTVRDFEVLRRKYQGIKDLYRILDCDEVFSEPDGISQPVRDRFPLYRYMDLRLAKEGTQVLVKRMEEGHRRPDLDWLHSRTFIDPPGVSGLSPAEYDKMSPD